MLLGLRVLLLEPLSQPRLLLRRYHGLGSLKLAPGSPSPEGWQLTGARKEAQLRGRPLRPFW